MQHQGYNAQSPANWSWVFVMRTKLGFWAFRWVNYFCLCALSQTKFPLSFKFSWEFLKFPQGWVIAAILNSLKAAFLNFASFCFSKSDIFYHQCFCIFFGTYKSFLAQRTHSYWGFKSFIVYRHYFLAFHSLTSTFLD